MPELLGVYEQVIRGYYEPVDTTDFTKVSGELAVEKRKLQTKMS